MSECPENAEPALPVHDAQTERLAQWTHSLCQSQPAMTAPTSLQSRVFIAIEQRANQWWRHPLRMWPMWARALSLLFCAGSVWLVLFGVQEPSSSAASELWAIWPDAMMTALVNTLHVLRDLLWLVVSVLPTAWLLAVATASLGVWAGVTGLNRLADR